MKLIQILHNYSQNQTGFRAKLNDDIFPVNFIKFGWTSLNVLKHLLQIIEHHHKFAQEKIKVSRIQACNSKH